MGIFDRLNRVIKSNVNSMIDSAEDPEKIIAQTITDMESELKNARKEVVTALASEKLAAKKRDEAKAEVEGWERKAMLALETGDEELAREALRRKMKSTKDAENYENARAQHENYVFDLKKALDQTEEKIEELKMRKTSLASRVKGARRSGGVDPLAPSSAPKSAAFANIERMQARIENMEAEVEVAGVLDDPDRASVDARFAALERGERHDAVDDDLAALKRKLEKKKKGG
ncbi:MAG: PspA/IM30 family protein [Deltaproteobacteria bacterium]|nr:PspA/IM30 family protein [Deltaproteobacteria bacterium]